MKYFEENIAHKSSEDPNPENKDDFTNNSLQMVVKWIKKVSCTSPSQNRSFNVELIWDYLIEFYKSPKLNYDSENY